MKTHDQILRHLSHIRFSDEDWEKVKEFCKGYENCGKIYRATKSVAESDYETFVDWVENGLGSGDVVEYGNTLGIVGDSLPDNIYLVAYLDFDKNVIAKRMDVMEPERLKRADAKGVELMRKKMYEAGWDYTVKTSDVIKMYTPKERLYYVYKDPSSEDKKIGLYLQTKDNKYFFAGLLNNGKIEREVWVDINYTPLRPANEREIHKFHKVLEKSKLIFNERIGLFVQSERTSANNLYYYLNDKFEIERDIDNGSKRHLERFSVGNYFLDYTLAIFFMDEVRRLRYEN